MLPLITPIKGTVTGNTLFDLSASVGDDVLLTER
jgi:hypothetical protein